MCDVGFGGPTFVSDDTWPYSFGFVWLISRIFSVNEQYFSLKLNQSTVLSVMAYQPDKPKRPGRN